MDGIERLDKAAANIFGIFVIPLVVLEGVLAVGIVCVFVWFGILSLSGMAYSVDAQGIIEQACYGLMPLVGLVLGIPTVSCVLISIALTIASWAYRKLWMEELKT